jgi:hypothetical protein
MPVFNVAQALLWICNCMVRKFAASKLEARLAFLAKPRTVPGGSCAPPLVTINEMFSKGASLPEDATMGDIRKALRIISDEDPPLPGANTRGDIQKALQAMKDERPRAASVLQRALDELARKLLDGKLTMIGRRARQPATILLKNGGWTSIEYPRGCGPVIDPEIIPAAAFAELRFIDTGDGIEAVPLDYPARKFPCWRDLSVREADVRRLWPAEPRWPGAESTTEANSWQPDKKTGRPKGTGYTALDAPLVAKIKKMVEDGKAKSHTEAASMVIGRDGSRANGAGSVEAKISRLVGRAKKTEKK